MTWIAKAEIEIPGTDPTVAWVSGERLVVFYTSGDVSRSLYAWGATIVDPDTLRFDEPEEALYQQTICGVEAGESIIRVERAEDGSFAVFLEPSGGT